MKTSRRAASLQRRVALGAKITLASQDEASRLSPFIDEVLAALGCPQALVTDESTVSDFVPEIERPYAKRRGRNGPWVACEPDPKAAGRNRDWLAGVAARLGVPVARKDRIVVVARRLAANRPKK